MRRPECPQCESTELKTLRSTTLAQRSRVESMSGPAKFNGRLESQTNYGELSNSILGCGSSSSRTFRSRSVILKKKDATKNAKFPFS